MIALFDPKDINRSASNYNLDKLLWLNSHYIKNSSDERLIKLLKDFGVDLESNPKSQWYLLAQRERGKDPLRSWAEAGIKERFLTPSRGVWTKEGFLRKGFLRGEEGLKGRNF